MEGENDDSTSVGIFIVIIGIIAAFAGLIHTNFYIWSEIKRKISLGQPVWSIMITDYVFAMVLSVASIVLLCFAVFTAVKNPKKAGFLCIIGSYPGIIQCFINSVFIYETREIFRILIVGYAICSSIGFISAQIGGFFIIRSISILSKQNQLSNKDYKEELTLFRFSEVILGLLTLIGVLINFLGIYSYIKGNYSVETWILTMSNLGMFPLICGILLIITAIQLKTVSLLRLFQIFFASWGLAAYIFGWFTLYTHIYLTLKNIRAWIFVFYLLVLFISQTMGLVRLNASIVKPSKETGTKL